jgi:hypothetical protein
MWTGFSSGRRYCFADVFSEVFYIHTSENQMKAIEKYATPDYEKYDGIDVRETRGVLLQTLRQLSNFEAPKLAIVGIVVLALAMLWKGDLSVVVQIVMVLAIAAIGIADAFERKLNAPSTSHNRKGPLELGHAGRSKRTT